MQWQREIENKLVLQFFVLSEVAVSSQLLVQAHIIYIFSFVSADEIKIEYKLQAIILVNAYACYY